ncbi:hypothetical protein BCR34DRAFT_578319 [Clohesyomyces aquaticus]|uniref:Uncharacterized protein n=1 Tax=Clohesyomyces aquaticus TaxID=1231657 RepID=A0A1Y1YFU5_9PLEO|nr:hypothetical protein BCR34DRAFT_578319 [Clohesyomyces aquaticus]
MRIVVASNLHTPLKSFERPPAVLLTYICHFHMRTAPSTEPLPYSPPRRGSPTARQGQSREQYIVLGDTTHSNARGSYRDLAFYHLAPSTFSAFSRFCILCLQ